jgi:hypothetical protein
MAWGKRVALLVAGALSCVAACSSSSTGGSGSSATREPGDHLVVDVDASSLPDQPDPTADPDSAFAPVDGSAAYQSYDAYAVLTVCAPADGGGGDGAATATGTASGDAGAYGADGAATGCQPLPAACASKANCDCLIGALAAQVPCTYPHCSVGTDMNFSLYCP